MTTKVICKDVRGAFLELFAPKAIQPGDKPAYSGTGIFPPDHPAVKLIKDAIKAEAQAKWPKDWQQVMEFLERKDKLCLHNGNDKAQFAGFAGNLYVSARNPQRPAVRDADGKTPLTAEDGRIYSGARIHMILEIWAQDHAQHGKRVNASLVGVQFFRDADRFGGGGGAATDDDFEDYSTSSDDDYDF